MNESWLGLPPAQTTVRCAEHQHRIRWEQGVLHAVDHEDPEGERALAALGGPRCTCIDVLDAWERHRDDPRLLVLGSRGPADQLWLQASRHSPVGVSRLQIARARPAAAGGQAQISVSSMQIGQGRSTAAQAEEELIALLRLGGAVQDRVVVAVAATWRDRLGHPDRSVAPVRPALEAALYGRACAALRTWLGGAEFEASVRMIGEGDSPRLAAEDGLVAAELPFGWLVDVWAKGLATIWGRFCLEANTVDGTSWSLHTVGPDLGPPELITLRLGEADTSGNSP